MATPTVAIIGLDVVGTSLGLALGKNARLHRIGHDREPGRAQQAKKQNAVDKVEYNLPRAVEQAQWILITEPVAWMEETFQLIGPVVPAGSVVVDFAPVKRAAAEWAARYLPAHCSYVGLMPAFNPQVLSEGEWKGRADLFSGALIAVTTPPGASEGTLQGVEALIRALDARPLFSDAAEIDGLMSRVSLLPALTAAAMLHTTLNRPGWQEGRKLAGWAYRSFLMALQAGEADSLHQASLLNRDNVLRALEDMLTSLQQLRAWIEENAGESLEAFFQNARLGGEEWWKERQEGNWENIAGGSWEEIPSFSERLGQAFLGRNPKR
jgi:prephenate dehydrogenase